MTKLVTKHEPVTIADGVVEIDCFSERTVTIELSNRTAGDPTAGTLTFRGKVAGSAKWQDINDVNVIEFGAYSGLTVEVAALAKLEVTTLGITGTDLTDKLFLAISRFDFRV